MSSILDVFADFIAADLPFNGGSQKLEVGNLIMTGQAFLLSFTVLNTNVAAQYVQLHDVSQAPSSGAIPAVVYAVSASSNLSVAFTMPGRRFHRGIYITNSQTAATFTAGSADCYFDVQYISAGLV